MVNLTDDIFADSNIFMGYRFSFRGPFQGLTLLTYCIPHNMHRVSSKYPRCPRVSAAPVVVHSEVYTSPLNV